MPSTNEFPKWEEIPVKAVYGTDEDMDILARSRYKWEGNQIWEWVGGTQWAPTGKKVVVSKPPAANYQDLDYHTRTYPPTFFEESRQETSRRCEIRRLIEEANEKAGKERDAAKKAEEVASAKAAEQRKALQ
ncbi:MAG: hypothetical protein M1828_000593 [Chrysothrix sp. TS-e1954]|nr:MAG: hypothetical protein M1828_000593 [Chrysothrix sp. TS-e1954]